MSPKHPQDAAVRMLFLCEQIKIQKHFIKKKVL